MVANYFVCGLKVPQLREGIYKKWLIRAPQQTLFAQYISQFFLFGGNVSLKKHDINLHVQSAASLM